MTRAPRFLAPLLIVALVMTGCAAEAEPDPTEPATTSAGTDTGSPLADPAILEALPRSTLSTEAPVRVADGILPPTNRWYSSLAFSDDLLPVYPFPIAVAPSTSGLAVSVPDVVSAPTAITASFTGGLGIDLGATDVVVSRTDPVSVTLTYTADGQPVADVTLAEGSPIVAVSATADLTLTIDSPLADLGDGAALATRGGERFLLVGGTASGSEVTVTAGGSVQIAALPDDADIDAWRAAIGDPVTAVEVAGTVGAATVTTALTYAGTSSTVLVPFPGREGTTDCTLGTFDTAYGPASACAGTTLSWDVARIDATQTWGLDSLTDADRDLLRTQIAADLAATGTLPTDTYYGGKALARLGTLLSLARELGDTDLADAVADRLQTELEPWLGIASCDDGDTRCLVYDPTLATVTGRAVSFGSENANDHHFHYGYVVAAAAALGSARPDLVDELRPVIDALAADIADGAESLAPALRVFDPYRGHSWASGTAPFADGNNQESSSEAVAAWNGLALWASVSGASSERVTRAVWLLSAEADAARALWLEPDLSGIPAGYEHGIVSLTWSAKRDYATWFSAEPSAILGIQLLPLGPVMRAYLASSPERVTDNVAAAGGDAAFDGPLGDYVLAYSALGGDAARAHAWEEAQARTEVDDGSSLSALYAFILTADTAPSE